ncbi:hypothetical protein HRR83_000162 [Exophiala dermatitidis]|uniref:VWFA domain-containing protein n=2 Tax=Exophiala dermatitidis TaxID=5970 RepID=H6C8H4_EXODN|nr:uncharacterized protein HMPREF1120_08365 [Exophiala dermatitidis NIH/UT8656]KAJ4523515.1 hypothetical protein HRR73_002698 [Exophiala dermatitidis]EHY60401.1 hypothetical protein HMPREF1120_08365 [Exophiala dermatitidis NIH/UT8656]KAJ4527409.1 hypothetical protein HRR74_000163 [Exophiala dermatitidis]KAJ4530973.1 hypothetical protein HRR76_008660 [Exophiala dermatitidis]KAJ4558142.1 hypothetical protein HRR77_000163 [Exophiala dermatitidis]
MEDPVVISSSSFHSHSSSTSTSSSFRARQSTMDMLRRFGTKRSKAGSAATSTSSASNSTSKSTSSTARSPGPFMPATSTTPTRRPPPSNDPTQAPPPPYSAAPYSPADLASPMQVADDSPYAFLREFDTIFLIDDSGSMAGRSWRETAAALSAIAPICTSHDADGIDIYFLNHRNPVSGSTLGGYTNVTTTAAVEALFRTVRPLGGTPTGTRLNHLLKPYLAQLEDSLRGGRGNIAQVTTVKPLNIIVITDGVPSDDVESVIVSAARKLDAMGAEPWQVGVQFFQVGSEPEAAENLRELDDALSGEYHIRDMVDTVPFTGEHGQGQQLTAQGLLKVCLGSVVRRHDRRAA